MWGLIITRAKKATFLKKTGIPTQPLVSYLSKADCERINDNIVEVRQRLEQLAEGLSELYDRCDKFDGMLKYCYAICQNPGIKELADQHRDRGGPRRFKWGSAPNSSSSGGDNGTPRGGLGGAGRPF